MNAALAWFAPDDFLADDDQVPGDIGLGTCVRLCLTHRGYRNEEGVVIEVVPPDMPPRSARVTSVRLPIASETRYVVQCWDRRVLRRGCDLAVQAL